MDESKQIYKETFETIRHIRQRSSPLDINVKIHAILVKKEDTGFQNVQMLKAKERLKQK
ncbi:hypothetical protein CHS0354_028272, partial [Potamilus streckersoni]